MAPFGDTNFRKKSLEMPLKLEEGIPLSFSTSILSKNIKKDEGGPFKEKNRKKSHNAKKLIRGNFGLARYCNLS